MVEPNGNGHELSLADTHEDEPAVISSADLVWLRQRMMSSEALADARHNDTIKRFDKLEAAIDGIKQQAPSIAEKRALMVALATVLLGVLAKFVGVDIPQLP